jgi:hypothetical protein
MKKSIKKIQLKKHSISVLNTKEVTGGISSIPMSAIYNGEDNCVSIPQKNNH